jgi:hypothetical protein
MDTSSNQVVNPKDAIGSDKLPIHLFPTTAVALGCLANLHGNMKYGRLNWRAAGIRYTVYLDAIIRHAQAALEGEDVDPESGLPHEAHILASAGIIVDANATGQLMDDRNYKGSFWRSFVDKWTPHVKRLKDEFKDKKPKHWLITDNDPTTDISLTSNDSNRPRDMYARATNTD